MLIFENIIRVYVFELKVKISSKCFVFVKLHNRDPDKPKRSLPSFVDKLPEQFPVCSTLLDTSFPRTVCTATALTSFSYGSLHTCSLMQPRRPFHVFARPTEKLPLLCITSPVLTGVNVDRTRRESMRVRQKQMKTPECFTPRGVKITALHSLSHTDVTGGLFCSAKDFRGCSSSRRAVFTGAQPNHNWSKHLTDSTI